VTDVDFCFTFTIATSIVSGHRYFGRGVPNDSEKTGRKLYEIRVPIFTVSR
jgi:hypothetical protein